MAYKVQLEKFNGPLDLLLYLVRRSEVNIYDIPIADITKQYLEFIQLMRLLDLDIAGDFIVTASTLIRIKAKLLLPAEEGEVDPEDEDDPRARLIRNLLEYEEYKKLAENMQELETEQRNVFYRLPTFDPDDNPEDVMLEVSLFDLLAAFKTAVESAPEEAFHQVARVEVSLDERIAFLRRYMQDNSRVRFTDLFPPGTARAVLVTTFIAMLELIKGQFLKFGQSSQFGEIWIYYNDPLKPAPAPPAADPQVAAADPSTPAGTSAPSADITGTAGAAPSPGTDDPTNADRTDDSQMASGIDGSRTVEEQPLQPEVRTDESRFVEEPPPGPEEDNPEPENKTDL